MSTGLTAEITELLDELVVNASPRSASTVSRLAYRNHFRIQELPDFYRRVDSVLEIIRVLHEARNYADFFE